MRIVNKLVYKILLATYKPHRFNEIAKEYHISPRSLSQWLYYLNQCGLIERKVGERPIKVEYTLTPKGNTVLRLVCEIVDVEPKLTKEGYI